MWTLYFSTFHFNHTVHLYYYRYLMLYSHANLSIHTFEETISVLELWMIKSAHSGVFMERSRLGFSSVYLMFCIQIINWKIQSRSHRLSTLVLSLWVYWLVIHFDNTVSGTSIWYSFITVITIYIYSLPVRTVWSKVEPVRLFIKIICREGREGSKYSTRVVKILNTYLGLLCEVFAMAA